MHISGKLLSRQAACVLLLLLLLLAAGKMIDSPTVLQARNVLALAERLDHVS
jgi:hypothetical protein